MPRILSHAARPGKHWQLRVRSGGLLKGRQKVTREITIETTETTLSWNSRLISLPACQQCGQDSRLVPFTEIVTALEIDPAQLRYWVSERCVHFQFSGDGGLSICWKTLSALLEQRAEAASEPPLNCPEASVPPEKGSSCEPSLHGRSRTDKRGSR